MEYDARTALVVVDVQNDFADPRGSLYVKGGEEIVDVINAEIAKATRGGGFVVYTQDWHPPSTPHFEKDGGTWPVHCVMGTWGAEFYPRLDIKGPSVKKGSEGEDGYSGFTVRDPVKGEEHETSLESLLRERGIHRLVVTGLATDYCVRATALDGVAKGFEVIVLKDAVRGVNLNPGDDERALEEMEQRGVRVL